MTVPVVEVVAATAVLLLVAMPLRRWLAWMRVPSVVTLLALGVGLGPAALDVLPDAWLDLRADLAKAALVVILLRAGLGVPRHMLRAILVPALVLGTIPVFVEVAAVATLARGLVLDHTSVALLAGFIVAAISPAVVIPAMQLHREAGLGAASALPDRVMGLALVNVLVAQSGIFLMLELTQTGAPLASAAHALSRLPLALAAGLALGAAAGGLLPLGVLTWGSSEDPALARARQRVVLGGLLTVALALYFGATALSIESVFAVVAFAIVLRGRYDGIDRSLRADFHRVWSVAEILLFVALGSQIEVARLAEGWLVPLLCAIVALSVALRAGVTWGLAARFFTDRAERCHVAVAQIPKATVQAVFGALPLQTFLAAGQMALVDDGARVMTLSVVSIVITAPLGAWLIERSARRMTLPG